MLLNQLQQLLGNLRAGVLRRNIKHEMGCFAVKLVALLVECLQLIEWVSYLKQRAVLIILDAPV